MELKELKENVRSIIISNPNGAYGVPISQLLWDYKELFGEPMRLFGSPNAHHLLTSLTDAVKVEGFGMSARVFAPLNEKSQHIAKLVAEQKKKERTPARNHFRPAGVYAPPPTRAGFQRPARFRPRLPNDNIRHNIQYNTIPTYRNPGRTYHDARPTYHNTRPTYHDTRPTYHDTRPTNLNTSPAQNFRPREAASEVTNRNSVPEPLMDFEKMRITTDQSSRQASSPPSRYEDCSSFTESSSGTSHSPESRLDESCTSYDYDEGACASSSSGLSRSPEIAPEFAESGGDYEEAACASPLPVEDTSIAWENNVAIDDEYREYIDENCTVPIRVQQRLLKMILKHPEGMWLSEIPKTYAELFDGRKIHFESYDFRSLYLMFSSLPKLFRVVRACMSDWMIYGQMFEVSEEEKERMKEEERLDVIPNCIKSNVRMILVDKGGSAHIDEFRFLYKRKHGHELDHAEYGFKDVESFLEELAFQGLLSFTELYEVSLPPMDLAIIKSMKEEVTLTPVELKSKQRAAERLPSWVANPFDELPPLELANYVKVGRYVDVAVAEVFNPNKFFLQLRTDLHKLDTLMNEMQRFYTTYTCGYQLHPNHVFEGMICAGRYKNYGWHRLRITSVRPNNTVMCYYVDFGSEWCLKIANLRSLHRNFMDLKVQAFGASLYAVRPLRSEVKWSVRSREAFIELSEQKDVVAGIVEFDEKKNWVKCTLTNTLEDKEVHYADELVDKGLVTWLEDGEIWTEPPPSKIKPPLPEPPTPEPVVEEVPTKNESSDEDLNIFKAEDIPELPQLPQAETIQEESKTTPSEMGASPPPTAEPEPTPVLDQPIPPSIAEATKSKPEEAPLLPTTKPSATVSPPPPYSGPPPGFDMLLPPQPPLASVNWPSLREALCDAALSIYASQFSYPLETTNTWTGAASYLPYQTVTPRQPPMYPLAQSLLHGQTYMQPQPPLMHIPPARTMQNMQPPPPPGMHMPMQTPLNNYMQPPPYYPQDLSYGYMPQYADPYNTATSFAPSAYGGNYQGQPITSPNRASFGNTFDRLQSTPNPKTVAVTPTVRADETPVAPNSVSASFNSSYSTADPTASQGGRNEQSRESTNTVDTAAAASASSLSSTSCSPITVCPVSIGESQLHIIRYSNKHYVCSEEILSKFSNIPSRGDLLNAVESLNISLKEFVPSRSDTPSLYHILDGYPIHGLDKNDEDEIVQLHLLTLVDAVIYLGFLKALREETAEEFCELLKQYPDHNLTA